MVTVIIAGGSGSRLWPLSTPDYPKHLLKINGGSKSLLQLTHDRAKQLTDDVYVISETSHIKHVKKQLSKLPDKNIICEPARRGTANCILAALARIKTRHPTNEPIAFIHADHYIRDISGFVSSLKLASDISSKQKQIVLIGVEPDYPSTAYGYIEKGNPLKGQPFTNKVMSFKEKPDFKTASKYVKSGKYLWNGGYFVASVDTFIDNMKKYAPELYESFKKLSKAKVSDYDKVYLSLENDAIDYALMEKGPDLLVIPASFDWVDLGSYSDLHQAVGSDEKGNHINGLVESVEVENSFIENQESKPVVVIGLDNVVVINTKDGILVARKDLSQVVGEVSRKIYSK